MMCTLSLFSSRGRLKKRPMIERISFSNAIGYLLVNVTIVTLELNMARLIRKSGRMAQTYCLIVTCTESEIESINIIERN